ncbi:MAG: hypothetical protein MJ087_04095 [Lachnospiraceae bacterium]|nr:hypothetical protein [Lachnospiraceae bacterium]
MKKILAAFAVILLAVIAGCYGYYMKVVVPQEKYAEAEAAFQEGDYKSALALYEKLGDYKDAKIKAEGIGNYYDAVELMSQGKLKKAYKKLKKVNKDADLINCDKLKNRCKTYQKMHFTIKAKAETKRVKEDKFDLNFGYFGSVLNSDTILHVRTTIDEDGNVHIGAYTDTDKKENVKAYKECTYERNSKHLEWSEDNPEDDNYRYSYSYSFEEKILLVSGYTKKDGRMDYQKKYFFGYVGY